jgi:hypothetical protein
MNVPKNIDNIFKELGMDTPELSPITKYEAISMGLIQGNKRPQKGICGKSVYSSESKVSEAINHRFKKGFGGTSILKSYYCNECLGWHMTSRKEKFV